MLVSKLLQGVVVVERGSSRRAFRPKFVHRLLLAWLFRNFASLPMSVLTTRQKAMVANIIAKGRTIPVPDGNFGTIIGTVESFVPQAANGKPVASSTGWEFARRRATGNRISA
jgi:hypothetical protein